MPVEPIIKALSPTDVGESQTHQSGILIPVKEGERFFPSWMTNREGVTVEFRCRDHTGKIWIFGFTHRAKRSESRITRTTAYIRRYLIRSGDVISIHRSLLNDKFYEIRYDPSLPLQLDDGEDLSEGFEEGIARLVRVNQYERDPRNRELAIKRHGTRCYGCRLEMAELYGEIACGYIHIHHTKPLSSMRKSTKPNLDDLVPLCPNCHMIVHLKNPPMTIKCLKDLIAGNPRTKK